MSWSVPGYVADELVGFGAAGEVWRGRDTVTGETVALKRLRAADAAGSARLRREAALLAALDHPHLLRLRDTVCVGDEWVLVLDFAAGGSLAALLRHRGRLRPGEVVTALAPLAAALAYAHGEGLIHGDVTPANVLFSPDGRPLLADLGVARVAGEADPVRVTPEYADPVVAAGAAPGPASDVFAVAAVAFHALTGVPPWNAATPEDTLFVASGGQVPDLRELAPGTPEPLVEVLQRALSAEPAARGSAAELALDMRHACPPEAVALPCATTTAIPDAARPAALTHSVRRRRPVAPPEPQRGRHHRPIRASTPLRSAGRVLGSRGLLAVVLVVAGLAIAVRLGVAWAGSDGAAPVAAGPTSAPGPTGTVRPTATAAAPSAPSPSAAGSASRWAAVLSTLDSRRQAAFAATAPAMLSAVYLPGSSALAGDVRQLREVAARRTSASGVRHDIHALRVIRAGPRGVLLDVTESLAGYDLRRAGTVVRQPPGPPRRYRIQLRPTGSGWRIASVEDA